MSPKAPGAALAALLCAALTVSLSGCAMMLSVPGEKMAPTQIDISELGPGSLNTPVLDYKWVYNSSNTHVRITGTIMNDTDAPIQGVVVSAVLYDQDGSPIAYGQSYLSTSYLQPGGKGDFEFMALVKREKGVTATRLVVTTRDTRY
ncbi:MAG: FxLYD domain-containing protein [Deltaproteobacteria bacterium]|jgi:hypothetical protein|nr:FxLYD domain-containing protein [Deltaproteobacteria bacterium]